MSNQLVDAIAELQETEALALTRQRIEAGADPAALLDDCRTAMGIVGQRFQAGEYFLPELIFAGELLKQIAALVKPLMRATQTVDARPKVLIGTVKGDIHDIGKDIVAFLLEVNGFEVHDVGVDVPAQVFVEQIARIQPQVVALSGFLTIAFEAMKQTVSAIEAAGWRQRVKIMVGGGTVDDTVRSFVGADAFGADALAAVSLARGWVA